MNNKHLFLIVIFTGLTFLGIANALNKSIIGVGILIAIITGIVLGIKMDKDPQKYTFLAVSTYSIIAWVLMLLLTKDGKILLESGIAATSLLSGFAIMNFLFNAIVGSFAAFVACNISDNRTD
ncbi:MAG: hypothetical protein PWQ51_2448 [Methanolobus sp.]|jgi:hypothetical protein|uniref:hypothetical protein n=1 Tax=Methanolobus sp. TaxID=1874737 RepID=UPI0024AC5AEF|nr:hypothetical protein [Methanolobus sp.]MDI3485259.1 hypothetical protein [Methanolobus sp.]MDK2832308.1 hypothetical protein [Methanolobus sp.]MDK2940283.1 hypothetical protein [Methanolobus sp.]